MSLKSMTGFGRSDGTHGALAWHWEIRSVNGRGLDLRLRLPPGYDAIEPRVRELVAKRVSRGSISVTLNVSGGEGASQIRLNEAALEQVIHAAERVRQMTGCELPRAEGLLALRGVLEVVEVGESEAERDARLNSIAGGLAAAIEGLQGARQAEGARLGKVFEAQLEEIARLVSAISSSPTRSPEMIRERLREQVARLLETSQALDPQRLHQEAVMIATRIDIEEELKRLGSHITAARELLASAEPVGRKLDFLTQEFNREANTICSKANDADIQRAGLALKAVIDQMREQVQNIE